MIDDYSDGSAKDTIFNLLKNLGPPAKKNNMVAFTNNRAKNCIEELHIISFFDIDTTDFKNMFDNAGKNGIAKCGRVHELCEFHSNLHLRIEE